MDEDDIIPSENEEENLSDNSDDDDEALNQKMAEILQNIGKYSKDNIKDPGTKKGTKNFIKMFQKNSGSLQSFNKLLNSSGHELTAAKQSGRKRTGGSLIPVQKNSKSRREFRHGQVLHVHICNNIATWLRLLLFTTFLKQETVK